MKLKIKVKRLNGTVSVPVVIDKGDWVDLQASYNYNLKPPFVDEKGTIIFDRRLIKLGLAMKLPKGYEALVAPRSSTFKRWGIIEPNSPGVIDNKYSGNSDEWGMPAVKISNVNQGIKAGDRVCQFKVQLSQNATVWQRIKNLFYSGIEFVEVYNLDEVNRGGFGSTGK